MTTRHRERSKPRSRRCRSALFGDVRVIARIGCSVWDGTTHANKAQPRSRMRRGLS